MGKRARRDYGEGSVYQRCSEAAGCPAKVDGERPAHRCKGRWEGSLSAGWTARGTRRRVTVTAPTEAEAKRRLRDKRRELEQGAAVEASSRVTVKAWAEQWLPIVERTERPETHTKTLTAVRKWIMPTIGHKRLADLTPADVRSVMQAIRAAGHSSSTQRRYHSPLMGMLKAAIAEGYPVPARVLAVPAPAPAVNDRADIPVTDARAILLAAAEDPAGARWLLALLEGVRQGEILGLTWDQVDLERRLLILSWQLKPLPYNTARDRASGYRVPDGYEARQVRDRWHLVRPKTKAGYRVIPLVGPVAAALAAWREVAPDAPHELVFHHPVGDPPKKDDAAWYALQDAAGVRHPDGRHYTIHEARHSTATLLLEAGVDPAVITAILGHSSIVTSRGYMHVKTAPLADALEKVAERFALSSRG